MKLFLSFLTYLFLFGCASPIIKNYNMPVMSVKSLPYPSITSYTSLGKVIGKACVQKNDSTSFVKASHIHDLSLAEQAAYSASLAIKPDADLLISVKTVETINPDNNEVCAEVRGEAVAINGISNTGVYTSEQIQAIARGENPIASAAPIVGSSSKVFDGICNVPFVGGFANMFTIGFACRASIKRNGGMTACDFPFFGLYANWFTLGLVCHNKLRFNP